MNACPSADDTSEHTIFELTSACQDVDIGSRESRSQMMLVSVLEPIVLVRRPARGETNAYIMEPSLITTTS